MKEVTIAHIGGYEALYVNGKLKDVGRTEVYSLTFNQPMILRTDTRLEESVKLFDYIRDENDIPKTLKKVYEIAGIKPRTYKSK